MYILCPCVLVRCPSFLRRAGLGKGARLHRPFTFGGARVASTPPRRHHEVNALSGAAAASPAPLSVLPCLLHRRWANDRSLCPPPGCRRAAEQQRAKFSGPRLLSAPWMQDTELNHARSRHCTLPLSSRRSRSLTAEAAQLDEPSILANWSYPCQTTRDLEWLSSGFPHSIASQQ